MRHASLFTGIGGFDLAAEWMGWENVFQVENDSLCNKVLEKNFPNTKRHGDIREFNGAEYNGSIDVLSGGFPCQDISFANKEALGIRGGRSGLWVEYKRVITEIVPHIVTIENVSQLLRKGFEKILYDLSQIGYNAQWECLQANKFGFNHRRERVFIVAYPIGSKLESVDIFESIRAHQKEPRRRKLARAINAALPANDYSRMRKSFDGVPEVMDQLKAYGNSIVPQIAFEIFKAIQEYDIQTIGIETSHKRAGLRTVPLGENNR